MIKQIFAVATIVAGMLPASAFAQTFPVAANDAIVDDGEGHDEVLVEFRATTRPRRRYKPCPLRWGNRCTRTAFSWARTTSIGLPFLLARPNEMAAHLRRMPGVAAADPNQVMHEDFTPNDPQLADQWHMQRVHAPEAWNFACGRGGATVAVVDTGVACENHGEFTRVMDLNGTRCLPGYDFVADREHANDDQGHGTHVAGTIAQTTNNGFGVAGLAYCATILPVKVLNRDGSGSLGDVAEGIRYAADQGAQVINLSLGGGGRSRVMADAVRYAQQGGERWWCARLGTMGGASKVAGERTRFCLR